MKKFALMLTLALPFVLAACGDDNEDPKNVTLDQSSITINYDGTATLKASEKDCVWESSNDFVATVDSKGVVKAHHAGTAVITAIKGDSYAKCNVVVNATNNNFTTPLTNWGQNAAWVKSNIPSTLNLTLYQEDASTLVYTTSGNFPIYIYNFGDNGLNGSTLSVSEEMDETLDLEDYLEQRYEEVAEDDYSYTFADANTLAEATVAIVYTYDAESESVIATWTPVNHTRGIADFDRSLHAKHVNIIRNLKK